MAFIKLNIFLVFFCLMVACTKDSKDIAGSTLETENSIAIYVQNTDGTLAAKAKVIVLKADNLAKIYKASLPDDSKENFKIEENDSLSLISQMGKLSETDENGVLILDSLPRGKYMVEAVGKGKSIQKGILSFEIPAKLPDSGVIISVELKEPVSLRGVVETHQMNTWVMIRGTNYATKVDSLGNFYFQDIPVGELELVLVNPMEKAGNRFSDNVILTSTKINVNSNDSSLHLIDTTSVPLDSVKKDTTKTDTTNSDTVSADTLVHFMFEDFENGVDNWYTSFSIYASGEFEVVDGEKRLGKVAHFTCVNDSIYNWALMGRFLGGEVDMSNLDSIVFWAKGSMKNYISFSFDIVESEASADIKSGKSWMHFELSDEWERYTVMPSKLIAVDTNSTGGNIGWDNVKESVTNISIFGGAGGEFWIDDIEVFGYENFLPKEQKQN